MPELVEQNHFPAALLLGVIVLPFLLAPLVLLVGKKLGSLTGLLALLAPLASMALLTVLIRDHWTGGTVATAVIEWVPFLGINLSLVLDGVSIFYGYVILGVGVLVCGYAAFYFERGAQNLGPFFAYLLLFMTSMLGAVFADNLISLFVFWELTGVASFLLIGFSYEKRIARLGARRALLVTFSTGLCLLAGFILLAQQAGTYELSQIAARGGEVMEGAGWLAPVMMGLIMLGAFGKSAQFPFQFWLPGAMAAPTPVSAYLHSATMVKLGVFLSARMFPIFRDLDLWLPLVAGTGFFTMLLGAFLALRSNDLKEILAYSTVSQLGFLIGFYGLGGGEGLRLDLLHVVSHVFYKGALFMVAGIVDHAAGTRDVRHLGGLARRLPLTALSALIAAAALAGLPPTTGFISKELMLAGLGDLWTEKGALALFFYAALLLSTVMTVAFALRFFLGVFGGKEPADAHFHSPGFMIQLPPLLLAGAALGFGLFPGVLGEWLDHLKVPGVQESAAVKVSLWHGINRELLLSAAATLSGIVLYLWANKLEWRWARIPFFLRFDKAFDRSVDTLGYIAKRITLALRADWPPAYLPIVIFTLLAFVLGAFATHLEAFDNLGEREWRIDPWRSLIGVMVCIGLVGVLKLRRWTAQLVALSVSGFFLTFYFVLYKAPDLAMTQILVESASVVLVLVLIARFSTGSRAGTRFEFRWNVKQVSRVLLSLGMGAMATLLVIFADLNRHPDPVGYQMLALSKPLAEGNNGVNTILVDFRAFDTMGEITVLLIATLAGLGLMVHYKRDRKSRSAFAAPGFLLGKRKEKVNE